MRECLKCRRKFDENSQGRPRVYCSSGCRRAAEFEIRRTGRQLEKLEEIRRELRHEVRRGVGFADMHGRRPAEQLEDCESDIAEREARLRELLTAADGE